jgi:hypothetical protein
MARKPSKTFTDKEVEIMRIVWDLGKAPGLSTYFYVDGKKFSATGNTRLL